MSLDPQMILQYLLKRFLLQLRISVLKFQLKVRIKPKFLQ